MILNKTNKCQKIKLQGLLFAERVYYEFVEATLTDKAISRKIHKKTLYMLINHH